MAILEGADGIDFINIYSKGKTDLGQWLSNFAHTPISIPEHGKFASIEAYWYWLGCRDDSLRNLHGFKAKQEGRKRDRYIVQEGFEELILEAIDIKLKTYPDWMLTLGVSTLPLCHFYEYNGRRIDAGFEWIVEHFELRRQMIKEWRQQKLLFKN